MAKAKKSKTSKTSKKRKVKKAPAKKRGGRKTKAKSKKKQ